MSKEEWRKLKEKEKNVNKGKNLFPVDPNSVKSQDEIPYMQRAGGSADGDDLKGKKKSIFSFGRKKKAPEPEPEPPKKKNPWTF